MYMESDDTEYIGRFKAEALNCEIFAGIDSGYKTFVTVDDLSAYLEANPPKDTAVLLKGSNGIGLERIIAYLK